MSYFEKVSFGQYLDDCRKLNPEFSAEFIRDSYDKLNLPKRATLGSAGYDLCAPYEFTLKSGEYTTIPLGIRWISNSDRFFLMIVPRSGLGFKNGVRLANTCGIIDSDYFCSDNEGHIFAKLTCDKDVVIKQGQGILQGIILPFYVTDDDGATELRNGGFGSTDRRN